MTSIPDATSRTRATLALVALLSAHCGHSTGTPYNATLVPQLAMGSATIGDARKLLGRPLNAEPVRLVLTPQATAKVPCPSAEEVWRYLYEDKHSSCATTLTFDDTGKLCAVMTGSKGTPAVPAHGPDCTRNP